METLHSLVLKTISTYPENEAVVYDDGESTSSLTYRELGEEAHQVECHLTDLGCHQEVVSVFTDPDLHVPSLCLGVLQCRCAFVILTSETPVQRLHHLIHRFHLRVIIIRNQLEKLFYRHLTTLGIKCDTSRRSDKYILCHLVDITRTTLDVPLAYVITTSGTTGEPKIVKVPHQCIIPNVTHLSERYHTSPDDTVFMASPLTFDPSMVDMFGALTFGATLLIVPEQIKMIPNKLVSILCDRHKVTILQTTPSLFLSFSEVDIRTRLLGDETSLRVLALGGETFPNPMMLRGLQSANNKTQFYNLYGITEVSSWATYHKVTSSDREVPLGEALKGTLLRIPTLDDNNIQEGRGELYIGGEERVCLVGHEKTLVPGKLRGTGDMVRRDQKGHLWYLGRKDHQIKRHGKRMNLDEMEEVIKQHARVTQACTLVHKQQLHLWVSGGTTPEQTIRMIISDHLPSHYQPDRVHVLSKLPVNKHGKIDRRKLLELSNADVTCESVKIDAIKLAEKAWKEALHLNSTDSISPTDRFLECGGNSLTALQFQGRVESDTGISYPLLLDKILQETWGQVIGYIQSVFSCHEYSSDDLGSKYSKEDKHKDSIGDPEERVRSLNKKEKTTEFEVNSISLENKTKGKSQYLPSTNKESSETDSELMNIHKFWNHDAYLKRTYIASLSSPVIKDLRHSSKHSSGYKDYESTISATHGVKDLEQMSEVNYCETYVGNVIRNSPDNENMKYSPSNKKRRIMNNTETHISNKSGGSDTENDSLNVSGLDRTNQRVTMETFSEDSQVVPLSCAQQMAGCNLCGKMYRKHTDHPKNKKDNKPDIMFAISRTSKTVCHCSSCGHCLGTCEKPYHKHIADTGGEVPNSTKIHRQVEPAVTCRPSDLMTLDLVWKYNTRKCVDASPLVVGTSISDAVVYIGSHSHKFNAISLLSGQLVWETVLPDRVESSACLSPDGQAVVVGCYDFSVYVLNRFCGEIMWVYKTDGQVKSSPCCDVITGLVLIGSHDKHIHAIDVVGRNCRWKQPLEGGSVFASPAVCYSPHQVYAADLTGTVSALHPVSGCVLWTYSCKKPVFSSPAVCEAGVVIGCVSGRLHMLNHQGTLIWTFETEGPLFSSPCVFNVNRSHDTTASNDYRILVGSHDHHIYCISKKGTLMWKHKLESQVYSSSFVFNMKRTAGPADPKFMMESEEITKCLPPEKYNSLYGPSESNEHIPLHNDCSIYVAAGCTSGKLYILNIFSGQCETETSLPGEVFSSPVLMQDHLVIGCRNDDVYCLLIK